MIYFCPVSGKWFKCSRNGHLNCTGYRLPGYVQTEAAEQTIIDIWNTIPTPPAPELELLSRSQFLNCRIFSGNEKHILAAITLIYKIF